MIGILTSLVSVPLLGGLIVLYVGQYSQKIARIFTQSLAFVELILSFTIFAFFDMSNGSIQMIETVNWMTSLGINLSFGVDGISLVLVLLSTVLILLVSLESTFVIHERASFYYAFLLFFETGILGVFTAMNLVLFYIFWELVLIPMFFMIGRWGGPRRRYAAIKFFIFTHIGSVLMLISFFLIYTKSSTFSILELMEMQLPAGLQLIAALGIFVGAAVKLPAVPIHTWLPDAHVEAPSPVSVLLAGLLLKMAGYAFIRLGLGVVPEGTKQLKYLFLVLGLIGTFYAALVAIKQKDLKRLIAFTSINHMSFILIAMGVGTSFAIMGAVFQMVSHGVVVGLMFFLSGIIQHHYGTREISKLTSIRNQPVLSIVLVIGSLAAFSAPTTSGFIGEIMIFFAAIPEYPWMAITVLSITFTAAIYLWLISRLVFRKVPTTEKSAIQDKAVNQKQLMTELTIAALLLIPIFALGIFPNIVISVISAAANVLAI